MATKEQLLKKRELLNKRRELVSKKAQIQQEQHERTPDLKDRLLPTAIAGMGRGPAEFRGGLDSNILGDADRIPKGIKSQLMGEGFGKGYVNQESTPSLLQESQRLPIPNQFFSPRATNASEHPNPIMRGYQNNLSTMNNAMANAENAYRGSVRDIQSGLVDFGIDMTNPIFAGLAGAGKIASGAKGLMTKPMNPVTFRTKTLAKVANKADDAMKLVEKTISNKYKKFFNKAGKDLNNAVKKAEIDDLVQAIDDTTNSFSKGGHVSRLKKIRKDIAGRENISSIEMHNKKQEIGDLISETDWAGVSKGKAGKGMVKKLYGKVNQAIRKSDKSGQYAKISDEYAQMATDKKRLSKIVGRGTEVSEKVLRGEPGKIMKAMRPQQGLNSKQLDTLKRLDQSMPNEMKFMHDFNAWKRGRDAMLVGGASMAPVAGYMLQKPLLNAIGAGDR